MEGMGSFVCLSNTLYFQLDKGCCSRDTVPQSTHIHRVLEVSLLPALLAKPQVSLYIILYMRQMRKVGLMQT